MSLVHSRYAFSGLFLPIFIKTKENGLQNNFPRRGFHHQYGQKQYSASWLSLVVLLLRPHALVPHFYLTHIPVLMHKGCTSVSSLSVLCSTLLLSLFQAQISVCPVLDSTMQSCTSLLPCTHSLTPQEDGALSPSSD